MEILMIRPYQFYFNTETASNNFFQSNHTIENANELAIAEFDNMVKLLRAQKIKVVVIQDTQDPATPDSIFPNNWLSTHPNGTVCLYPMFAKNRRAERKSSVLDFLNKHYIIENTVDLTSFENENKFLEGTGSMVLDAKNNIAYGCISERLDEVLFKTWCHKMNFTPICFTAVDGNNHPIYHTNVMMCVGDHYVVVCLDSIRNENEKITLIEQFKSTHKEIIAITQVQLNHFAGNMLQVFNAEDLPYLVLSQKAYDSLTDDQVKTIEKYNPLLPVPLPTIETLGGGSARCMMAEIYLTIG